MIALINNLIVIIPTREKKTKIIELFNLSIKVNGMYIDRILAKVYQGCTIVTLLFSANSAPLIATTPAFRYVKFYKLLSAIIIYLHRQTT